MADVKTQLAQYLQETKPLLVEFYTVGCERCQDMEPILAQLRAKMGDKVNILQIDKDAEPELAKKHKIKTCPSWIVFKDGEEYWHDAGRKPLSELEDMLNRVM